MRAAPSRAAGWLAWWGVGVPILVALLVCPSVRAEPIAARTGKEAAPSSKRTRSRPVAGVGHTVRPGESLWIISRQHGVSVDALAGANGIRPRDRLRVGQQLTVPGGLAGEERQEPPSLADIVLGPPPETRRVALAWPVSAAIGSPFGPRGSSWHGGIDIRAERGAPIRAAAPGIVVTSGWERGYGNVVKLWHVRDLMTVYAHNHENYVRVGDWVERGQVVATVGSTGRTTAPHLHFEVRLDGHKYDPLFWLPAPGAMEVAVSIGARGVDAVR